MWIFYLFHGKLLKWRKTDGTHAQHEFQNIYLLNYGCWLRRIKYNFYRNCMWRLHNSMSRHGNREPFFFFRCSFNPLFNYVGNRGIINAGSLSRKTFANIDLNKTWLSVDNDNDVAASKKKKEMRNANQKLISALLQQYETMRMIQFIKTTKISTVICNNYCHIISAYLTIFAVDYFVLFVIG